MASLAGVTAARMAFGRNLNPSVLPENGALPSDTPPQQLVRYPQKTDLILMTDRPPQLETPLRFFRTDLTPNDAFFVRWHLAGIPTMVDLGSFRLEISGRVRTPLRLSLNDLRSWFEPVSLVALAQCAGNSRSLFEPRVPGVQWGNGAMGNARWKGVRLKDVLDAAGVLPGAVEVGLHGLDEPVLPQTPRFQKSLHIDHARDDEVMIAYEMNGAPPPMLSSITVLDQPLKTYWMDTAYRIPNDAEATEDPERLAPETVPISRMPVHSIFVSPASGEALHPGKSYEISGVATDGGSGIHAVDVSMDAGRSWNTAELGTDRGRYSWRRWKMRWKPSAVGPYQLMVRATTTTGETQPTAQWNRSGYQRAVIERCDVMVR